MGTGRIGARRLVKSVPQNGSDRHPTTGQTSAQDVLSRVPHDKSVSNNVKMLITNGSNRCPATGRPAAEGKVGGFRCSRPRPGAVKQPRSLSHALAHAHKPAHTRTRTHTLTRTRTHCDTAPGAAALSPPAGPVAGRPVDCRPGHGPVDHSRT